MPRNFNISVILGQLRLKRNDPRTAARIGLGVLLALNIVGAWFVFSPLGGSADETASIGQIMGPGFSAEEVPAAIEKIVDTYIGLRNQGETFLGAYRRLGPAPFKEAVYVQAAE